MMRKRKGDGGDKSGTHEAESDNASTVTSETHEKERLKDDESAAEKKHGDQHREKEKKHKSQETHKKPESKKSEDHHVKTDKKKGGSSGPSPKKVKPAKWRCLDNCFWLIGCICCFWWIVLVLYNALPTLPEYITEKITGPLPNPPGIRLAKEGLRVKHPVIFVPGIVTGGLELWEGRSCSDGLFRKRLWGGTFGDVYKRPFCWMEHMTLDNETGMDLPGIRLRATTGLSAADYFAPGYFVWAVVIDSLARIGYEEKNMYMASYDWRLSFQNTEARDQTLSRLKSTIETMVETNGHKLVAIPHSMGSIYFLFFMKWVEAPKPFGGGGGPDWCAKYLRAVINIGGPFLGVTKAFSGVFSAEAKDVAVARAAAPGFLDSELFGLQTLQHIMRVSRTWDATTSMLPKGGELVWGDADWSPEEGFDCSKTKKLQDSNGSVSVGPHGKPYAHYGRLVSFGKEAAQQPYSEIKAELESAKITTPLIPVRENVSCGDSWTEYQEMSWADLDEVVQKKVYTAGTALDLLRKVAPKFMQRADENWGYGVADNPSDKKYDNHKYWSNPLETTLPIAPEVEMYCAYGVGILTERSYIYSRSATQDTCFIPFRIDSKVEGESEGCLKGGVHLTDGDETVTALSAGFMCAKGWRGKTKYNPGGSPVYLREYKHEAPTNLLEGRGTQSAAHVDIMGNYALMEDILKIAAGWTGDQIGGDKTFSDIHKWSERIKLDL